MIGRFDRREKKRMASPTSPTKATNTRAGGVNLAQTSAAFKTFPKVLAATFIFVEHRVL